MLSEQYDSIIAPMIYYGTTAITLNTLISTRSSFEVVHAPSVSKYDLGINYTKIGRYTSSSDRESGRLYRLRFIIFMKVYQLKPVNK